MGDRDVNQHSIPHLAQLQDPPDPPGEHVSSVALRECGHASATMEHSLASKKQIKARRCQPRPKYQS